MHCAGQIVMTCQEKGGGCKTLGWGVGAEVLRGESFMICSVTLQQCTVNTQEMFAESEPPKTQGDEDIIRALDSVLSAPHSHFCATI